MSWKWWGSHQERLIQNYKNLCKVYICIMSAPMSTPITNIPVQSSQPPIEEDPEVNAILQEMQQSAPQPAVVQQHAVAPMRYAAPIQPHMHASPTMVSTPSKPYFHSETAQRAVYAALIAYVLFYPKTLEMVYARFSFLEKFQSYDMVIRFMLLAIVLYALMWKFHI